MVIGEFGDNMKIRIGFVSNSSSSSFVIPLIKITAKQLVDIVNHSDHTNDNPWTITVTTHTVEGYTSMDNFDMREFLVNIGVEEDIVNWERS
jgi:hypothetical protein